MNGSECDGRTGAAQEGRVAARVETRLRRLLARVDGRGRSLAEPPDVTVRVAPEEAPGVRCEPDACGRLLVWKDRFADADWHAALGPALFGEAGGPLAMAARLTACREDPRDVVFLDIETCGLADDPVFLVGLLVWNGDALELVQYLAPDPSAEPALLRETAALLATRGRWVSFNGRAFDVPRLERRAARHGLAFPRSTAHRDLLLDVRRRWRTSLPDCRLATVETRLLALARPPGDVPGREVPERYYDFVRGGDRRWIDPVIVHNRHDVAALAALLLRVLEEENG